MTPPDLVYGFRLTMEELARHWQHLQAAAAREGQALPEGTLPLDAIRGLGFAVHARPEEGRTFVVGWSLLASPEAGAGAPVDRARLQEAAGKVQDLQDAMKLQKPAGYWLVSSSSPPSMG